MYVSPRYPRQGAGPRRAGAAGDNGQGERLPADDPGDRPGAAGGARQLYRTSGYQDVPAFGHYAGSPLSVHLGKRL